MDKREIEEQAILAFNAALRAGFITDLSGEREIDSCAYEILELMPDYDVRELSDEDFDYAVDVLKAQVY